MGVSLNPKDAIAGGLLDDVTVLWQEPKFELWDYNGSQPIPVPALKITLLDPETKEEVGEQFWSCGSNKDWKPSADGKCLESVGKATALVKSSNFMTLMHSLISSGFPPDKLEDDISVTEGLIAHMVRKAADRKGLKKDPDKKKDYEDAVLEVVKIVSLPWDKKEGKGKGKGAGASAGTTSSASASTSAPPDDEALKNEVVGFIMQAIADKGGQIAKKDLPALSFQVFKDRPEKGMISRMVFDDKFLSEGPWKYENGVISLG